MAEMGRFNQLRVIRIQEEGARLDAGGLGHILLPRRRLPPAIREGDLLDVFVYADARGKPLATTEKPRVQAGECAWLKVVSTSRVGAFLDWGLTKDLLVPFAEQRHPLEVGRHCLVFVFIDNSGRIAGSTRLNRFIADAAGPGRFKPGDAVSLILAERTDLGMKAVIDNEVWGLIYHDALFQPVRPGQRLTGYVRRVRPDGKVELTLQAPGYAKVGSVAEEILQQLRAGGGWLPLNDKSPPNEVRARFQTSKAVFKQAIGALYRQQRIRIEKDGIRLL